MDLYSFYSESDDFGAPPVINSHAEMEKHVNYYVRKPGHSRLTLADYIKRKRKEKRILQRFDLAKDEVKAEDPDLYQELQELKEEHESQEALACRIKYHPNVLKAIYPDAEEDEDVEELQLPQDPPKRRFNFKPRLNTVWQQRLEASRKEKERRAEEARRAQEERRRKKKGKKRREKKGEETDPVFSSKPKLHETLRDRAFEAILTRLFRRQWVATMVSPVPEDITSADDSHLPTPTRLQEDSPTPAAKRRTSYPPSYLEIEAREALQKATKGATPTTKTSERRNQVVGNHIKAATEQTSGSSSLASRLTRASVTSSLSHARPRRPPIRGTRTSELRRCVRLEALQKGCRACSSKRLFGGGPVQPRPALPIEARAHSRSLSQLARERGARHPSTRRSWSFQSLNLALPDSGGSRKSGASAQPLRPDTGYISLHNPQPDLVTAQVHRAARQRREGGPSPPPDVVPRSPAEASSRQAVRSRQTLAEETALPCQPSAGCKTSARPKDERPLTRADEVA
ncbi:apoptotic chromatin condensation inducer in the nucleus-like isoform X2 [Penaeus vannamei]|uniref:apoptotic chromatin condensation inducer in the nucleus-like isoform X2 n=1 Tax=Penaeus vannamei TaxID=6689 RepID=UPI00387F9250